MLLSKEAIVKWNGAIRKWYEGKGYTWTKNNDEFSVGIDDLQDNSKAIVLYSCDYCGSEVEKTWQNYRNNRKRCEVKKDACDKCKYEKMKEANMLKYGVENVKQLEINKEKARQTQLDRYGATNVMKLDSYKQKLKDTLVEKYGVENVMYLDNVKDKIKETNIDRYGVDYAFNSKEIREEIMKNNMEKYGVPYYSMTEEYRDKIKATSIERYGVEHHTQSEEWKDTIRDVTMQRYGVENISQIDEVKYKKSKSFYSNGTVATSKQQLYLNMILEGELNYSDDTPSLDIAFVDKKIYVEYNGSGHDLCVKMGNMTQEYFDNRERARYYYMKKLGWKAIFINSPRDYLPSDEIIFSEISKAIEWFETDGKGHNHYNINIGVYIDDDKYGKLRRIKDEDLETA